MRGSRRAQRGVALLGLLAVAVMVFAYVLTSRLNAASQFVGIDRDDNAKALAQAKRALIGWMALNAAGTDANPGRLPCPEAPGDYGTVNEGRAAGNCTLPAVGRFPWRTLGLEKLADADGEPLWFVVSPGWALSNSTSPPLQTLINSDSQGQLSFEGTTPVALIVAPGPALVAQAGTGCTAWTQSRPVAGPPDLRNYLECENATSPADATFVASRAGQTFNDQVLPVMAADVIPALEAAIADRAQREVAPALKSAAYVLDSSNPRRWVASSNPPIYPYATPFSDPTTSNYLGALGTYQGLLPFNPAQSSVAYQATPADAVETLGFGYIMFQTCSWETADARLCEGRYHEYDTDPTQPIRIQMIATFTNVAMGLRVLDTSQLLVEARDDGSTGPWTPVATSYRAEMNDGSTAGKPRGSVTFRFWGTLPNIDVMGWDTQANFRIRINRAVIADHCLLSISTGTACPSGGPDTSWFARNQWQRNSYYAVAQNNTAAVLPSVGGCDSTNCLRLNDSGNRNIYLLLTLAGRRLDTQTRPSASLADYLEFQNADAGTLYEQHPMRSSKITNVPLNAPWNDRLILVDWVASNPPVAPGPQVVTLAPVRLTQLP
ncbi:MAG TPA: hypothetical protein VFS80_16820 [Burkholderiales bacterium]|nr:hypothetical protein [Burkholderiales bacterium]